MGTACHAFQLSIPVNVGEKFCAGLLGAWCIHFLGLSVFVNYCGTHWGSWGLCGFSRCLSYWSVREPPPQVHPAVLVSGALGILMGGGGAGLGLWSRHVDSPPRNAPSLPREVALRAGPLPRLPTGRCSRSLLTSRGFTFPLVTVCSLQGLGPAGRLGEEDRGLPVPVQVPREDEARCGRPVVTGSVTARSGSRGCPLLAKFCDRGVRWLLPGARGHICRKSSVS